MIHCIIYSNHYIVQGREIHLSYLFLSFTSVKLSPVFSSVISVTSQFLSNLSVTLRLLITAIALKLSDLSNFSSKYHRELRRKKYPSSLPPISHSVFVCSSVLLWTYSLRSVNFFCIDYLFNKQRFWEYLYWNPQSSHIFGANLGYTMKDNGRQSLSTFYTPNGTCFLIWLELSHKSHIRYLA